MIRVVTLGEQPAQYLDQFEPALRTLGYSEAQIQTAAAKLFEIYHSLITGEPRWLKPHFICPDKRHAGASFYQFSDDQVEGVYSASPTQVNIVYLSFSFDEQMDANAAITRIEGEAAA